MAQATPLLLSENTFYRQMCYKDGQVLSFSYKGHSVHPWAKHKAQL